MFRVVWDREESVGMWTGEVLVTQIAERAGAPMVDMREVLAVAGQGLEGDRYFKGTGFFSHDEGPRRQITLFETEVIDAMRRDQNVELTPGECRMNLLTRNVPLSQLVGRKFRVGITVLRGVRLNEPCQHLEDVVGKKLLSVLVHRCGLNAEIMEGGIIRPGDEVVPLGSD